MELLVVISVIALLASLILGVGGVASRKSKESRIQAELNRYVTLIENYKAKIGAYPPCNEGPLAPDRSGVLRPPLPHQLYYELSGTIYSSQPNQPGFFYPVAGNESNTADRFDSAKILSLYKVDGFANSARERRRVKFQAEFKPDQIRKMTAAGRQVNVLVAPVPPPARLAVNGPATIPTTTGRSYPWYYDSISTNRFNAESFDLWTEVQIGNKFIRFSNWEPGPVVFGP